MIRISATKAFGSTNITRSSTSRNIQTLQPRYFKNTKGTNYIVATSTINSNNQYNNQSRGYNTGSISKLSKCNQNISNQITAFLLLLTGLLSTKTKLEETPKENLPIYKMTEVQEHDGRNGTRIWMTYAGNVYDVTDFIVNHPGGSEKILQASGSAIEPFWNVYRQHFATDVPSKVLETLLIGTLDMNDQERIDDALEKSLDDDDPYKNEPFRHPLLKMHSEYPANAEVPSKYITNEYITPNELFYIRNHHPVPYLSSEDVEREYRLNIDLTALGRGIISLCLEDIRALPKFDVVATLQCSGNRRGHFNRDVMVTSGTPW